MTVVCFIYQEIYCRYLSPGEYVIPDRGVEFANQVCQDLFGSFGNEIRMISVGRPQANGQAERAVETLNQKMRTLMSVYDSDLPTNWDQIILYRTLSVL